MSPIWRINHLVTRTCLESCRQSLHVSIGFLLYLARHLVSRSCCGRTSVALPMDPSAHCFAAKANNSVNNLAVTHIKKLIPSASLSSWRYLSLLAAAEAEANKSILVRGATHDVHRVFFTVPALLSEESPVLAVRHVCVPDEVPIIC